jgi:flagellar protein FliS
MSNAAATQAAYRRGAVMTATREQLVVLLYDGARRFLRKAAIAMRAREVEAAHKALRSAERIIDHLDGTLDMDQGDLAQRLRAVYRFYLRHLNEARMTLDADKVEAVSNMLGELREAWATIAAEAGAE